MKWNLSFKVFAITKKCLIIFDIHRSFLEKQNNRWIDKSFHKASEMIKVWYFYSQTSKDKQMEAGQFAPYLMLLRRLIDLFPLFELQICVSCSRTELSLRGQVVYWCVGDPVRLPAQPMQEVSLIAGRQQEPWAHFHQLCLLLKSFVPIR